MPPPKTSTQTKKAWLWEWLVLPENFTKSTDQIRQATREQFGEMLGTALLNKTIREIRDSVNNKRDGTAHEHKNGTHGVVKRSKTGSHQTPHQSLIDQLTAMTVAAGRIPIRETLTIIRRAMDTCGIEAIRITSDDKVEVTMNSHLGLGSSGEGEE